MYFKFPCPSCGKSLKVSESHIGQRVRCPYCHATSRVPAPEQEEHTADQPQVPQIDVGGVAQTASSLGHRNRKVKTPSHQGAADGTNVGVLSSALWGAGIAAAFFLLLLPLNGTYFGDLFLDRGWVPFVLVFLMGWSGAILILKSRKLLRQKESMLFDVLPSEISEQINPQNIHKFADHVRSLRANPGESFLLTRVLRGLEHFRVRRSNPEVAQMLVSQSEIDANAVEGSYTLLKVFIWAIPILGFIGTVVGISNAVGGFAGSLDQAQDIAVLKESLNSVTSGLAVAFDTTLVALVMSLIVMFPTSSLQQSEEDLLNWVDEYCNENLVKRLNDESQTNRTAATGPDAIRQAIDESMVAHHAELQAWHKKLDAIGPALTKQVVKGWQEVQAELQEEHKDKLTQASEAVVAMGEKQQELLAQIQAVQAQMTTLQQQQLEQMQSAMNGLSERTANVQEQVAESMTESAESMQACFANLTAGLESLNRVLASLGEQHVVVQSPPPKRGWGLFRSRNGG